MSLFERISKLVRVNLIDLLEGSRDPEQEFENLVEQMEEHLAEARTLLADAARVEKLVASEKRVKEDEVLKWEKKALLALDSSQEDLAREAVRRKIEAGKRVDELAAEVTNAQSRLKEIQAQIEPLEEKLADARAGLRRLRREKSRADRDKSFQGIATDVSLDKPTSSAKFEDQIAQTQLEAKALQEIREGDLETRFERLEHPETEVDLELAKLRAKIKDKREHRQEN